MTITTNSIAVSTVAVSLLSSSATRKKVTIKNTSTTKTAYIGGTSSLTSANGMPVYYGDSFVCNDYTGDIYGICGAGDSATIVVIEEAL